MFVGAIFWNSGYLKAEGNSPEDVLQNLQQVLHNLPESVGWCLTYKPADWTIYADRSANAHIPLGIIWSVFTPEQKKTTNVLLKEKLRQKLEEHYRSGFSCIGEINRLTSIIQVLEPDFNLDTFE